MKFLAYKLYKTPPPVIVAGFTLQQWQACGNTHTVLQALLHRFLESFSVGEHYLYVLLQTIKNCNEFLCQVVEATPVFVGNQPIHSGVSLWFSH